MSDEKPGFATGEANQRLGQRDSLFAPFDCIIGVKAAAEFKATPGLKVASGPDDGV
jgi:hypothetical protein